MKLSDVKVIHILLIAAFVAWIYLFFDWQKTRYQLGFDQWRSGVVSAINDLNKRIKDIELSQKRNTLERGTSKGSSK